MFICDRKWKLWCYHNKILLKSVSKGSSQLLFDINYFYLQFIIQKHPKYLYINIFFRLLQCSLFTNKFTAFKLVYLRFSLFLPLKREVPVIWRTNRIPDCQDRAKVSMTRPMVIVVVVRTRSEGQQLERAPRDFIPAVVVSRLKAPDEHPQYPSKQVQLRNHQQGKRSRKEPS